MTPSDNNRTTKPNYGTCDPQHEWAEFLRGTEKENRHTSQNGEDGVLAALFAKIGTTNKWCFEVGAGDGHELSNVHHLFLRCDWNAALIEASPKKFAPLRMVGSEHENVHVFTERVDSASLERCLSDAGAPLDMDLGVIDVDCQEYWLWKGMAAYKPRVMLVEWAYWREWDDPCIPPEDSKSIDSMKQAGMAPLKALGEELGYTLLATIGCNLVFVRTELMG